MLKFLKFPTNLWSPNQDPPSIPPQLPSSRPSFTPDLIVLPFFEPMLATGGVLSDSWENDGDMGWGNNTPAWREDYMFHAWWSSVSVLSLLLLLRVRVRPLISHPSFFLVIVAYLWTCEHRSPGLDSSAL